jgi:FlaA1/EpsC-like NDP-sugar epimerase
MTTRNLATAAVVSAITAALSSFTLALLMLLTGDHVRFASLVVLIVIAAASALAMMVFLAIYMYQDARSRGMSGTLAVLLLLLVGPPGLVIYLLIRSRRMEPSRPGEPAGVTSR